MAFFVALASDLPGGLQPMADSVADAIEENARGPKRVTVSEKGETVEQHPIPEQIAADQHAKAAAAAQKSHFGLRFGSINFPGAA
jgi:hypothetical protein